MPSPRRTSRQALVTDQPRIRNGKVITDPATGKPVRNKTADRRMQAELRAIEREHAKLTGLPPDTTT